MNLQTPLSATMLLCLSICSATSARASSPQKSGHRVSLATTTHPDRSVQRRELGEWGLDSGRANPKHWPERYRHNFVHYVGQVQWHNDQALSIAGPRSRTPMRGLQAEPLKGLNLYLHIRRHDLAIRYKRRRALKLWALGLGIFKIALGALITARNHPLNDSWCLEREKEILGECIKRKRNGPALFISGIVLSAFGHGATLFGSLFPVHPLTRQRRMQMLKQYNAALLRREGG